MLFIYIYINFAIRQEIWRASAEQHSFDAAAVAACERLHAVAPHELLSMLCKVDQGKVRDCVSRYVLSSANSAITRLVPRRGY